jgi:glycosyltransferase involved in cell wall biosynthesis
MTALNDVTILITTFLRPQHLYYALRSIKKNLPECEVAVACDDDVTEPRAEKWAQLPYYDSGLTAKRNAAARLATKKYCLLGCDDFEFTSETRRGVERMYETLEAHPEVDVVVGTYNGVKYEGHLIVGEDYIKEQYTRPSEQPIFLTPYPAWKIDIGINYFLARTSTLLAYPWDETIAPIGGEHCDFFLTLKENGRNVVFVKDCNINSFSIAHEEDPKTMTLYWKARKRADIGHEIFMKKRGKTKYYNFRDPL